MNKAPRENQKEQEWIASPTSVATHILSGSSAAAAEGPGSNAGRACMPSCADLGLDAAAGEENQNHDTEMSDIAVETTVQTGAETQRSYKVPLAAIAMGDAGAWKELHRKHNDCPTFPTELPAINRLLAECQQGKYQVTSARVSHSASRP